MYSGFGYVFLIGSMYKQIINFNQSIKQCLSTSKKYAFLLKVISLWIKVDFAISWRKVKIWLTSTNDSVFGKRVLTYWENRGTPDCSQMNGFMIGIENYIFLERGKPHLSKNA